MTGAAQRTSRTTPRPRAETLVDVVMRRAEDRGDALAYVFLTDGSIPAHRLTYAQLDRRARGIADALLAAASAGDRALLVYESGLDFVEAFVGCMYAGIVAVPIPAPQASRVHASMPRMRSVAGDCEASLLLGNARTHEMLRDLRPDLMNVPPDGWIDTGSLRDHGNTVVSSPRADALAYLQYTSGSTATPKGVMISHAHLTGHTASMREALQYDESSVSISWMPHFHDYGLIEGIVLPLFNGTPAYLMSPFAFLKRPLCWLAAIDRFRGTHTQGPNFAYRYCARRISTAQREGLDLASLKSAGNGGEPIHPETSEEFFTTFAPCGLRREALRPAYGLAEATLMVTASPMVEAPILGRFVPDALAAGEVVPVGNRASEAVVIAACGRPIGGVEIAIVDPESSERLDPSRVGEVWVRADWVALGYWQRDEETENTFGARIANEGDARYLRTGDLGFLFGGQLFITSRRKDLIIIRGLNHYPQDIEWTVQRAHPALRADHGAAFGLAVQGEERLGIVQELMRGTYSDAELDAIVSAIVRLVGDVHGVAVQVVALIERGSLLKTTSGKVQRHANRDALLNGSLRRIRQWSANGDFSEVGNASTPVESVPERNATGARAAEMRPDGEVETLLSWLRDYAGKRIDSRLMDERRCVPPHIILDFGNRGLFGLQAPRTYGGLGLSHTDTARVLQQLGAIDLSLATLVFLHNTNGIRPILEFARPGTRQELMPLLATGRELAAFALSEPAAGSNLAAMQTRAARGEDGGWRIDGIKRWNGSAWCGVISVFARSVDAEGRLRGMTGFVMRPSDPGVHIGPEALTMGMRGIMQNALQLDGVRVSPERLLGEPGQGKKVVESVLYYGRIAAASVALGAAMRCAQLLARFVGRREIETGRLLHNPQALEKTSELAHRIAILQELIFSCTTGLDSGVAVAPEISMVLKTSATETLNFAADVSVQLLGGRGYMENNEVSRIHRDARALSIGEGANESLIGAIGRSLRFTDAVAELMHANAAERGVAAELLALKERTARERLTGRSVSSADVAWRDALLGRAAAAALELGSAISLTTRDRRFEPTRHWARLQFDRRCREAAAEGWPPPQVLSAERVEEVITAYCGRIGDLDPLPAGVETEPDPLLRRPPSVQPAEASTAREVVRPAGDPRAIEGLDVEQKRELLRRLLTSAPHAPLTEAPPTVA